MTNRLCCCSALSREFHSNGNKNKDVEWGPNQLPERIPSAVVEMMKPNSTNPSKTESTKCDSDGMLKEDTVNDAPASGSSSLVEKGGREVGAPSYAARSVTKRLKAATTSLSSSRPLWAHLVIPLVMTGFSLSCLLLFGLALFALSIWSPPHPHCLLCLPRDPLDTGQHRGLSRNGPAA